MVKFNYYQLKSDISLEKLFKTVSQKYTVRKIKTEKLNFEYYDTFDWRLYKKGYYLIYNYNKIRLESFVNNNFYEQQLLRKMISFKDELPSGNIKSAISNIIGIRALIVIAKNQLTREYYTVLDNNQKIVLKLIVDNYQGVGKILFIEALRGFDAHIKSFNELTGTLVTNINKKDIFKKILNNNKKQPGDYNPGININLKPNMSSQLATQIILKNLYGTIRQNEKGIIEDIDTEFLHDFRVATRRTRAALSQIKYVFDPQNTKYFNDHFRRIGKRTNKLRDIDVYLLNKDNYKNRLSGELKINIEPFFQELQTERVKEHKNLSGFIKSKKYQEDMNKWHGFIDSNLPKSQESKNSNVAIIQLASKLIYKQYSKILNQGSQLTVESPDNLYHNLRIQCKKLRYLLEFFISLYNQKHINYLIKQLKKLQDNLGSFNDLYVQQETLIDYSITKNFNSDVVLSIGFLVGKLNEEQMVTRKSFVQFFKKFSNKNTKNLFDQLFVTESRRA